MKWRTVALVAPHVSGDRALADVRGVAAFHRIQNSPGYDAAAEWLVARLREAGFTPEVERVRGDGVTALAGMVMPLGWSCTAARAALDGEPCADFEREPLSLVQRSIATAGRWPVVTLPGGGDGSRPEHYDGVDVRGRVLLTDGAVARVHALAVRERGAAGLLSFGRRLVPPARTREHDRDSLAYTSFWWGDETPDGWGFVLSPNAGEALWARLEAGARVTLEASIDASFAERDIPLVSVTLPGPRPGEVLVTAHLCHPFPGANDNGSGVAAALESARVLGALARAGSLPGERRTIRWLWMPEFTGTYAWLARRVRTAGETLAALNLDMVGEDQAQCASAQQLELPPHFAASFAEDLLAGIRAEAWTHDVPLVSEEVRYGGGSDHAVWLDPAVGVPCPMLIQWPDRYYHSNGDTPDRCDPRSLAHAATCGAAYALAIAAPEPRTIEALAAAIEQRTRRRLRLALDAAEPARAVRAALRAGQQALASLERLVRDLPPEHACVGAWRTALAAAADAMEGHFESEIAPGVPRDATGAAAPPGRVPVRVQRTPLCPMRAHQYGWSALSRGTRERFLAFEAAIPGGTIALEVAWCAADGARGTREIAELVRDEGHAVSDEQIEEFFALAIEMGAARWRE